MPIPKSRTEAASRKAKAGAPLRTPDTLQSAPAAQNLRAEASVASVGTHSPLTRPCGAFHLRAGAERAHLPGFAMTARASVRAVSALAAFAITSTSVRPP